MTSRRSQVRRFLDFPVYSQSKHIPWGWIEYEHTFLNGTLVSCWRPIEPLEMLPSEEERRLRRLREFCERVSP